MSTAWSDYGYPRINLVPTALPAAGLVKALAERGLPWAKQWDMDAILQSDPTPLLTATGSGLAWARAFDRSLAALAPRYLNQYNLNLEDLADIPYWSFDTLAAVAAGAAAINTEQSRLRPEWCVRWALQRRAMINLLLWAPVAYTCKTMTGSCHTGEPSTPEAAIAAAAKGATIQDGKALRTVVTSIWGPDHGWREGSYCADVTACGTIRAVLPDGIPVTLPARLCVVADSPDADPDNFDAFGTGLTIGFSSFAADDKGLFTAWPLPATPDRQHRPTPGHTTTYGWVARRAIAFADFSSFFKFVED